MQKSFSSLAVIIAVLSFAVLSMPFAASALTIPTRTPTPEPGGGGGGGGNPPVNPPGGGGGGGGGNPAPTETAVPPTAEPTATVINIAPTPDGGFEPTAQPCSTAPTVLALSGLNVRSGPGTNFEVISTLVFLETRRIAGRAGNAEWWLILLADGSTGWVADFTVDVQGYTGFVPIVPAPSGTVDGPEWNPTPQPGCEAVEPPTETPSPTETAVPPTETATNTPTPISEERDVVEQEDEAIEAGDSEPTATATSESDAAVVAVPPRGTEVANSEAEEGSTTIIEGGSGSAAQATAVPLNIEPTGGNSGNFLPIAGGGLLAAGVAGWFFMRQRGKEATG